MKKILLAALVATAGFLFSSGQSLAQTTYNGGDVLLGFRALSGTGQAQDYVLNLGPVSQFTSANMVVFANNTMGTGIGNIFQDLSNIFGATWYTDIFGADSRVQWGVAASLTDPNTGDPTVYGSRDPATRATPWNNAFVLGTAATAIDGAGGFYGGNPSTANSPIGVIQTAADTNSWAYYQPGGVSTISFNYFNPTIEGDTSSVLSFDQLTQANNGPGTFMGTWTLSSNGDITWNGASAIPEPSTYILLFVGAGLFLLLMHRRRLIRR